MFQRLLTALGGWINDLSPACRQASELQSQALDNPLPARKRVGLWIHLRLCKWCRRYGAQIRFLREACRHDHEHPVAGKPDTLSPEARTRIKQRLDHGGE